MVDPFQHDDYDPLSVGRGIAFGILLGSLIWAAILAFVVYLLR